MRRFRYRRLRRTLLDDGIPKQIVEKVLDAAATIDWAERIVARRCPTPDEVQRLRYAVGCLQAALVFRRSRHCEWANDPERVDSVFALEARHYEGQLLRRDIIDEADGRWLDNRLCCLREIINEVKAGKVKAGAA